jgi:hypothetical protein
MIKVNQAYVGPRANITAKPGDLVVINHEDAWALARVVGGQYWGNRGLSNTWTMELFDMDGLPYDRVIYNYKVFYYYTGPGRIETRLVWDKELVG